MKARIIPNQPTVQQLMKRSKRGRRKFEKETGYNIDGDSEAVFESMCAIYNEGTLYKSAGKNKLSYLDFIASHEELNYIEGEDNLPWELHKQFCDMLYEAFCDGFDGIPGESIDKHSEHGIL